MTVLAIDPGPVESAWVVYDGITVAAFCKEPNDVLIDTFDFRMVDAVVVEMIASYGMPVGAEVFETCVWIGRFVDRASQCDGPVCRLPRRDVKLHLCQSPRANDATIRQALIDKFGGKEKAIGKKAAPGPLYGLKADCWQALALAVTWWETTRPNGLSQPSGPVPGAAPE